MLRRLILAFALLLVPALAQARGIEPQLVAEGPAPPGGEVELALDMRTNPGWHGYWSNPGDAGLPMEVQWQLPPGFSVGELRYPVPTRLTVAGIMNYVFERDYAVLVRLKVPQGARGTVPIRAEARWLACTDKICVPEQGALALDLPVGSGVPQRQRFDAWRQALPRPLVAPARFELSGAMLRLAIPLPGSVTVGEPYIFPADDGPVDYAAEQSFRRSGDSLIAELPRRRGEPARFAGLLALGDGRGLSFEAVPGPVPDGGRRIGELGPRAVLLAILGALAGGLLLNLMPCVFPILAIKALHLAKSGGDEREARSDALAYTAGAIISTGALGAALLALRAAGSAAGWAFQLQDPRTILLLLLLASAVALNLVGLFTVPALAGRARPGGSFGTGALAAFVATPCAGPFLGAALGTALLLPPAASVLVFAALGLGLAIPFLAVAFIPALRERLPKPGPWMVRLQRFLAIPMFATAAACLWLLHRQGGLEALLFGTGAALVLALALAWIGVRQRRGSRAWPAAAALSAAAVIVAVVWTPPQLTAAARAAPGSRPWSEAAVQRHLAEGRPVFVYFTADWCLTCKANETTAIGRSPVRAAFRERNVALLAGDWTNGDPAITRFLERQGRAGVPLYLWYEPGGGAEELPQVLTAAMLISRARRAR
ncbi:MAG TPA: protein-disulfide reductase DsbD domain-containing protein [Sphingomicrobium sp.]|nr:protein-disulfide reductase DsbD domain-containing protein [Sphingomicrobium sp.]